MSDKIKIRRGELADLPTLDEGELGLAQDVGSLYIGSSLGNILLNPVKLENDSYYIDGYLIPKVDNVHGLGTPDNRWHSLSVGPGSIHLISKESEPAGYKDWILRIDDSGNLVIVNELNIQALSVDPSGIVSIDSMVVPSFSDAADSYQSQLDILNAFSTAQTSVNTDVLSELDSYQSQLDILNAFSTAQSSVNTDVLSELDSYQSQLTTHDILFTHQSSVNTDVLSELDSYQSQIDIHNILFGYQTQWNTTVLDDLDGYAVLPPSGSAADGYVAFFTGSTGLAGDNDLFWDRANNRLGIGTNSPSTKLEINGVNPIMTIRSSTTSGLAAIDIGQGGNGNRYAYLDLVGDDTYTDYGFRILRDNAGANADTWMQHRGTGNLRLWTTEAAPILFSTSSAERMRIDSSGQVGIGCTPTCQLEINDSGACVVKMHAGAGEDSRLMVGSGGSGNRFSYLDLIGDDTYTNFGLRLIRNNGGVNTTSDIIHRGTGGMRFISEDAGYITLSTSSTERMRIDSSGQVGIGTDTPTGKLDIAADFAQNDWLKIVNLNTLSTWGSTANYDDTRYIEVTGGEEYSNYFKVGPGGVSIGATFDPPTYARLGVDSLYCEGNVGIGTIPSAKLHVLGSGAEGGAGWFVSSDSYNVLKLIGGGGATFFQQNPVSGSAAYYDNQGDSFTYFRVNGAGTTAMTIDSIGRVGIGAAPNAIFNSYSTTEAQGRFNGYATQGGANTNAGEINIGYMDSGNGARIQVDGAVTGDLIIENIFDNSAGDIRFRTRTNGTPVEGLTILGDGNVGVNATTPLSKFHVNTATDENLLVRSLVGELAISAVNDANSAYVPLRFDSSEYQIMQGNVGVGINSPLEKFHIYDAYDLPDAINSEQTMAWITGDGGGGDPHGLRFSSRRLVARTTGVHNSTVGVRMAWAPTPGDASTNNGRCWYEMGNVIENNLAAHVHAWGFDAQEGSAGTELMRLTSAGLGIGVTSPTYTLDVQSSGGTNLRLCSTTSGTGASIEVGTGGSGNRDAFIDLVGDDTYTDYGFRIYRFNSGPNAPTVQYHRGTGTFYFYATEAAPITFATSSIDRMTIDSSGDIGIGGASTYRLTVSDDASGGVAAYFFNDGNNADRYGIGIQCGEDTESGTNYFLRAYDGDGGETGGLRSVAGTFAVYDTSDERLKDNISPTRVDATNILKQLNLIEFSYKKQNSSEATISIGFSAQNCESVFPEMVSALSDEDGYEDGYLAISKDYLIPVMVKGWQEAYEVIYSDGYVDGYDVVAGEVVTLADDEQYILTTESNTRCVFVAAYDGCFGSTLSVHNVGKGYVYVEPSTVVSVGDKLVSSDTPGTAKIDNTETDFSNIIGYAWKNVTTGEERELVPFKIK